MSFSKLTAFFLSIMALAFFGQVNAQYSVTMPYKQVSVETDRGKAVFNGAETWGEPGQPALPHYTVSVLIPPEIDFKDVTVSLVYPEFEDLSGAITVNPCPPQYINYEPNWGKHAKMVVNGKDTSIFHRNAFFPDNFKGAVSFGKMWDYKIVDITIHPYLYNPVQKKLRKLTGGVVAVSFPTKTKASAKIGKQPTWVVDQLNKKLANPQILQIYGTAPGKTTQLNLSGSAMQAASATTTPLSGTYVIVTTNAISGGSTQLSAYRSLLLAKGFTTVIVATETNYGVLTGDNAATKANKIRTWLNTNKTADWHYVLLIGNPDHDYGDVPMKKCVSGTEIYGTDWYYADLSSDWEAGVIGNKAELIVGRIPVYPNPAAGGAPNITKLNTILQRTINYENATDNEWRRFALLPVVPLGSDTGGIDYKFGEDIVNSTLQQPQWEYRRLYDPYDYVSFCFVNKLARMTSVVPEVLHCNDDYVTANWNAFNPGLVVWHTHGNPEEARYILHSNPDYNTVPNLQGHDQTPAIVYSASCETSYNMDTCNLGMQTLYYNAVAYIGGTKNLQGDCGAPGFVTDIVTNKTRVGDAWANIYLANNGNGNAINLYGCPEIALNLEDVGASPAPLTISAQAVSSGQINVTWPAVTPSPNYYVVERGDASATRVAGFSIIAPSITVTNYQDNSVTAGTKYKYRVFAVNAGVRSGYSPIDSATTLRADNSSKLPGMVSGLTATPGCYYANLNWTAAPGATSYNIKRSRAADGPFVTVGNTTATNDTDINLLNGIDYYYVVSAVNEFGQSADFPVDPNYCIVTPIKLLPSAGPHDIVFKNVKHNSLEYWWTNSSVWDVLHIEVELSYDILVVNKCWTFDTTFSRPRDYVMWALSGVDNNRRVDIKVRACNEAGCTAWSRVGYQLTTSGPTPGTPINLAITEVTPESLTVSWSPALSGAPDSGYQVYHHAKGSSDAVFTLLGEYPSTTTSIAFPTLANTTDSFSIRAFNKDTAGKTYSAFTTIVTHTTKSWPLYSPCAFNAWSVSANEIDLSWAKDLTDPNESRITGFFLQRRDYRTDNSGSWSDIFNTSSPSVLTFNDNTVASEKNYEYRIRSKCTQWPGFSAWSNTVTSSTKTEDNNFDDFSFLITATSLTSIDLSWFCTKINLTYTLQWSSLHPDCSSPPADSSFHTFATVFSDPNLPPANKGRQIYTKTGLTPGVTYWFRIKGQNWAKTSDWSNELCSQTGPEAPTNLSGVAVSGTQVNLSWIDNSSAEIGFTIEQQDINPDNWYSPGETPPNVTTFSVCDLMQQKTYSFRVRAFNAYGHSAASNVVSIATPADPCAQTNNYGGIDGGGGGLHGKVFGLAPAYTGGREYCKATDGDTNTYYDYSQANGGYTGLDFGRPKSIGKIRYYPRAGFASRMVGGKFQGLNTLSGYVDLYTITTTPATGWNEVAIPVAEYQKVRYLSPTGGYCNIAEMEFIEQFKITAGVGANGSINPSGAVRMNPGDGQTFAIAPNSGYQILDVFVDGVSMGAVSSYTFTNVTESHRILAIFKYEAENATLSGGASTNTNHNGYSGAGFVDGFLSSATAQASFTENVTTAGNYTVRLHYSAGNGTSVNTGLYVNGVKIRNITCPATPDWDTWADNDEKVTLNAGNNTITYKAEVAGANCINFDYVSFIYLGRGLAYAISASAGINGSINPCGSGVLATGGPIKYYFWINPDNGCSINDLIVDGISQGQITNNSWCFVDVTADHTISATFRYEAENAALSGGANAATNHGGYSGDGFIDGFFNSATAQTTFTENVSYAGSYAVKLRYSAGNGASANTGLYVNGVKIRNITCPGTGNWDTWADETETVTLNAGANTITYKAETASANCINLDYISLLYLTTFTREGENATLSGGANTNTNHTGYSGTGFVDGFYNSTTAQASFTANVAYDGYYNVRLRYSTGSGTSSNTGLYVNGVKIKNITCPGTANWDTWADDVETVMLNAGANTIAYKAETASTSCINLDKLTVSTGTPPPVSDLKVYMLDQTLGSNQQTQPRFYIQNTGASPLSNFTLKYYFTVENGKTPVIENYYMSSFPGTLQHISCNDWCVAVTFSTTLAAGGRIPENDGYNFGLHYSQWESVWNQANDFSQPISGSYVLNGKVAIFNSSNQLIYGSKP